MADERRLMVDSAESAAKEPSATSSERGEDPVDEGVVLEAPDKWNFSLDLEQVRWGEVWGRIGQLIRSGRDPPDPTHLFVTVARELLRGRIRGLSE